MTGPKVDESTLGTVPLAAEANSAIAIATPLFGADDSEDSLLLTVPVSSAGTFVINAKTNLSAVQATAKVECRIRPVAIASTNAIWTAPEAHDREPIAMPTCRELCTHMDI